MKYGDYWKEELKGLYIMFNKIKFKVLRPYAISLKKLKKLEKKGYFEIRHEPTADEMYLYSSVKDISFLECIKLIKSYRKINIFVSMSFIYFYYCEEFYYFILNCPRKDKKIIRRHCYRTLKRWKSLMKMSDDILYPQNKFIKKIINELKI